MKILGDYIVLLVSIIGSFASIMAFGIYFTPLLNEQGWVGVAFLGILSLFFLSYSFYLIFKYKQKARYADIFKNVNLGFSRLHSIKRAKFSEKAIGSDLSSLCDSISEAFEKIYGNDIGVCIKFLTFAEDQANRPFVRTLVRDRKSKTKRRTAESDGKKHWIDGNSDFESIYSGLESDSANFEYFHEASLPICKDYKNTSLPSSNWLPKQKYPLGFFENFRRRNNWPLDYRSTLVVPIVPLIADERTQNGLRGYLCLDSPKEGDFNKGVDVDILKGISDGLYNELDKFRQLIKERENKANEN